MKILSIFILFVSFSHLLVASPVRNSKFSPEAQDNLSASISIFQHHLLANGFENIRLRINTDKQIIIEYENRRFRYEMTALGIVLKYATQYLSPFNAYIIVPKNRNIPIVFIKVSANDYENFIDGKISTKEFAHRLSITQNFSSKIKNFHYKSEQINNSFLKFDVILSPGFKVQFSRPNDPAQLQLNFLPSIQTTIAKGLQFQSQYILPFYNEFQASETKSRVGIIILNQFVRFPGNQFVSFSLGQFDLGYKGVSFEYAKFFRNESISLSTKIDYTTLTSNWSNHYKLHYLFKTKYRFTNVDFSIDACWGHFLFDDDTWRVSILRSFGELDLGFMGIWNRSMGLLTGLILNIPIPPFRQTIPRELRLTTPGSISWHYRYLPYHDGYVLNTGTDIEMYMKKLFPSFIKNNLYKLRKIANE